MLAAMKADIPVADLLINEGAGILVEDDVSPAVSTVIELWIYNISFHNLPLVKITRVIY